MASSQSIENTNRRRVWESLEEIKRWTKKLEAGLQSDPGGVIPYLQIEGISKASFELIYAAGHVNAIVLGGSGKRG